MHYPIIQSMYGGEVEDLRNSSLSAEELLFLPTSVRLHLTPLDGFSETRRECHTMCIIMLETDNEYPNR